MELEGGAHMMRSLIVLSICIITTYELVEGVDLRRLVVELNLEFMNKFDITVLTTILFHYVFLS